QRWVRVAGTVVSCLLLLAIAVRGAGCVRGERDRQTFDCLLMTPLPARQILWGKWWGCVLGGRAGWAWLGALWLVGLATGGVSFWAVPLFALAMAVFAGAFAWIGIWYSLVCRSTLRATLAAILSSLIGLGGFILVLGVCCITPLQLTGPGGGRALEELFHFLMGLSPAVVICWLPFRTFDHHEMEWLRRDTPFAVYAIIGVLLWVGISYLLSQRALQRFREETNRMPRTPRRAPRRGEVLAEGEAW